MKKLVKLLINAIEVAVIALLLYFGLIAEELPKFEDITAALPSLESVTSLISEQVTKLITEPTPAPTVEPTLSPTVEPSPAPTVEPQLPPAEDAWIPVVVPVTRLQVHQIAVGCANAYFIECGDYTMFVDGGTDASWTKVRKYLNEALGGRKLDLYIITCYKQNNDHNSERIMSQFCNEQTLVLGPSSNMRQKYSGCNVRYSQMWEGMEFEFNEATITCVGPNRILKNGCERKDSLNFILKFGEHKFFFGSNYVQSESVLAKFGELVKDVTVLQFPANGLELSSGRFAMSAELYAHMNPSVVLIPANSSGKAQSFAKNLGSDAKILDNGDGNIIIESDGSSLQVFTNAQPGEQLGTN